MKNCYLELKDIVKRFPGVLALDHVSFDLQPGEVHALVGENGAGKSTLIKVLSGAHAPNEGSIVFNGMTYGALTPWESKELGIEVVYQEFNLMPDLTAAENIYLTEVRGKKVFVNPASFVKKARALFEELGIEYIDPSMKVKNLTPAGMQMVEIAKAVSKPTTKIMVMDEPTAPLATREVEILFSIIRGLKEKGISVIYISHRLEEIFRISDRVTILRDGATVKTLKTAETDNDELVELMVGRKLSENFPPRTTAVGEECVLRVEGLGGGRVKDVSFALHRGEILGLGGLVGVGRTETVRMICGADRSERGRIFVNDKQIRIRSPKDALRAGITLVPEDRKQHGVLLPFSVRDNLSLAALRQYCRGPVINRKKETESASYYRESLGIKTTSLATLVRTLSGGNQQKVALGKSLATNSGILIMDEPTRGIDVGAKAEIYTLLRKLCAEGISVIMISSEMDELLGMSDRIVVLCDGAVAGILSREEATQEKVLRLATGLTEEKESMELTAVNATGGKNEK